MRTHWLRALVAQPCLDALDLPRKVGEGPGGTVRLEGLLCEGDEVAKARISASVGLAQIRICPEGAWDPVSAIGIWNVESWTGGVAITSTAVRHVHTSPTRDLAVRSIVPDIVPGLGDETAVRS